MLIHDVAFKNLDFINVKTICLKEMKSEMLKVNFTAN